ncbi:hypothetical protein [Rufibacter immobilis]|uniref:hypothetical protein n=1 Tax=Rufibacter immobilis TaxID=1348778 RepID=UPI0035E6A7AE
MATTFIIEEKDKTIFKDKIGYTSILYPSDENLLEDYQMHDWVIKIFNKFDPDSLVVPLSIQNDRFKGLILGLHIRLNHELNFKQRTIPLFFVSEEFDYSSIFSDLTLEIKNNRALPHYLLTTPNCFLEEPNLEVIIRAIGVCKPMTFYDYRHRFLDVIKINASETTGKHSIANIWGAFQLAKTTGHINDLAGDQKLLRSQKDLFFKFIRVQSSAFEFKKEENISERNSKPDLNHSSSEILTIEASGKNVLYIDDEANKGWSIVLSCLFKEANFEVVGRNSKEEFGSFYNRALSKALEIDGEGIPKWDLILLDLRLNEIEDIGDSVSKKAESFSGAKLLLEIKSVNKGTQVIMFTASNKAWNMRELMGPELGADGFFIKEAPEYNKDPSFSFRNFESFKQQVGECFEKQSLRRLCVLNYYIKQVLDLQDKLYDKTLASKRKLIRAYLILAYNSAAYFTARHKENALYSFLQYYKIVEVLGKELIEEIKTDNKPAKYIIKGKAGIKINFISLSSTVKSEIEPVIEGKHNIVGYTKSEFYPQKDEWKYYIDPTSSLRFSGLMILRFALNESKVSRFIRLNKLRNSVVAHSSNNANEEVKIEDVLELAEILKDSFQKI